MKKIKQQKAKLRAELEQLEKVENAAFIDKHYPAIKKKYEGKCFKTKTSYGGGSKQFYIYEKVNAISPEDVYQIHNGKVATAHIRTTRFSVDSEGRIEIDFNHNTYLHALGKAIPEKDYADAANKIVKLFNSL